MLKQVMVNRFNLEGLIILKQNYGCFIPSNSMCEKLPTHYALCMTHYVIHTMHYELFLPHYAIRFSFLVTLLLSFNGYSDLQKCILKFKHHHNVLLLFNYVLFIKNNRLHIFASNMILSLQVYTNIELLNLLMK